LDDLRLVAIRQFVDVLAGGERGQRLLRRPHVALSGARPRVVEVRQDLRHFLAGACHLQRGLEVDRVLVVLDPAMLLRLAQQFTRIGPLPSPETVRSGSNTTALRVGSVRVRQHQVAGQRLGVVRIRALHPVIEAP